MTIFIKRILEYKVQLSMAIILFFPLTLSIYFNKAWQESLLLFLCSISFLVFINIDKYELFKVTKDGLEIKTKIKEVDTYLAVLSDNVANLLHIQVDNAFRMGGNCFQNYETIKQFTRTIEIANIDDKELLKKIAVLKKRLPYDVAFYLANDYYVLFNYNHKCNPENLKQIRNLVDSLGFDTKNDSLILIERTDFNKNHTAENMIEQLEVYKHTYNLEEEEIFNEAFSYIDKCIEILKYSDSKVQ